MLRQLIVAKLQEHFHARVELASFHISLVKGVSAEGKGLKIWPPEGPSGASDANNGESGAPLISLAEFRFHAPLHYKPGEPIRISVVELSGLDIDVPPKSHLKQVAGGPGQSSNPEKGSSLVQVEVKTIECKNAHLTLETNKPGKFPLEFAIKQIKLTGVNTGGAMHFDAVLTNPRPAGIIHSSGELGPWAVEDAGATPVRGNYLFEHADLGVFKDIAGILRSTGKYSGVLRDLEVEGQTDTPDFRLKSFGTAVPLMTKFHAHVDGTNGDTWLQPVDATLGQSHFTAVGQIVGQKPTTLKNGRTEPGGHDIALKVNVDRGRMEDFLRLASHSGTPILTGDLVLNTSFRVPPGTDPVVQRMQLDGKFSLEDAVFTSTKLQGWVRQLSLRGQGQPKQAKAAKETADSDADVRSGMQSNFKMANGVVTLPNLKYSVPGAEIDLKGTYGIDGGALDFAGVARTEATVSKMVGGWKGMLLKLADPIFKKDGAGSEIPIHLNGTREDPKFGVDIGKIGHSAPQVPGQPQ